MPSVKLTGVAIAQLKPTKSGLRVNYFDTAHKGLCLRVGIRDKTWCYHYRFGGKSRSPSLGKYAPGRSDHMDRKKAISDAVEIDNLVDQGLDPKLNSAPIRPKPTVRNPNTFESRVKQFLKYYKNKKRKNKKIKPKTFANAKSLLTGKYIHAFNQSDVKNIKRAQLVNMLDDMDATPVQANRLHAYLNIFFTWCWDKGYINHSPTLKLKKRFAESPRTRFLSVEEIKSAWHGFKKLGYPLGDLCIFILATGQRPGECRKLNRKDIDNDIWLVEEGVPKNSERHRIPLPKIARKIVNNSKRSSFDFVFSYSSGKNPCSQGGDEDEKIYEAAGLTEHWTLNDLRRTFITQASEELDFDMHILGVICNQLSVSKPGVARVYNQARWVKQKKKKLDEWNNWLLKVVKK